MSLDELVHLTVLTYWNLPPDELAERVLAAVQQYLAAKPAA